MGRASKSTVSSDASSHTQQLDFAVGIINMTWPGIAAVESGFANLTAAGMRTTNVLNSQMNTLSAGMMAMGGIAALVLAKATAEAAQFEKQMSVVQALIKDNGDSVSSLQGQMEGLSAIAKDMSLKYGVSATDVAKSMETLGRAGLNTAAQMQAVLEPAIQLSKIEGIDVDTSADYIVKMTNLFGGTYENDSKEYATILAHAANISTTSATDIYNALKYSGGVASNIWGSATSEQRYENAKNITAMIATLSQQGTTGALAGTSIRSFFQYVTNPTAKSKKALTAIGLNDDSLLTVDEKGQKVAKSPMEIMNTLNAAFKANKMSDLQVLQWFQNWGQGKMGQQYVKLFPGGTESPLLADYVKKMNDSYSMQDRLNTIMSSTSEQLNKLKSAFEVMGISIGETSLPFLKALAVVLTDITGLLAHSKIAATAFSAVLYGALFAGLYSVTKWLAPLFMAPLRDMSSFVGKAKQQATEIKGTTTALGEEANAANNVAGAMDKKATAKGRATRANQQLATSARTTAASINKVKGEVVGATVSTREYTGRIQDLEKNYVPITAYNGSAADARKMAEYEKTMGRGTFFNSLVAENGLGYYGISNKYEKNLENLGKQVREQEWARGSVVQGDITNKLDSLKRDVAAQERAASLIPAFGTGSMWTARDMEYYHDEKDRINELARRNSVGRNLDYGKILGETNTPGNVGNLVASNMDAITWSQMSTVERMQARSEQIKGKASSLVERSNSWKKNLLEKTASSGARLASKAKNIGMTGLEWLGGLVGLGGVAGGALVAGAAVGVGAYYYAKSQGAFDTSNTKATKSLKQEIKYVKELSNKKDDLQKRIDTLTNSQSKYTEGSIQYRNIGKEIVNLNKDLASTTDTYNTAQRQLTKDEERAYTSNQKWMASLNGWSGVGDTTSEQATMSKEYGISASSSSDFNTEMNEVEKRNQTMANIQTQSEGVKSEFYSQATSAGRYYHTPKGFKQYGQIQKDYNARGKDYALSQGWYFDENTGQWAQMDPNATWTDAKKAYGWAAYLYDINKINWERGFASHGLQSPDLGKTLWNSSGLGGLNNVTNPKNWEGFGGIGAIMSLSKGDTLKNFFSNFGGIGALNGIFSSQTSKKKTKTNSNVPAITFNIGSITASSAEEAQNILKNSVVEAAATIFSQSNSSSGSG